ncbi:hypothetical protein LPB86_05195 [Pedobacter sp. MC2016-14]|uniref:hypothetical protein n=1 Tax=Pedobacter sp. MC2016-14 TaxID=2897327 RepID=UPI001E4AADF6|nr:hypothetical protein [Pedobacter sp. MC2016-14]MCD0487613.1 hypothetical protein [Pedobacter sp. MC2016-14]
MLSFVFEKFFIKSLANELSAYFDVAGKLDRLFELEKQYVDQKETSLGCFDHFYPGLKETIVAYIKSTIKMLKKKIKNKAVLMPVDLNGRLKGSDYKVRVSVSVPSLSCLLRTLIEAGCIEIEERSHFLDFISRCFVTPGKGRNAGVLSVSNLKNTYEKVSETALKAIKTVVLKMLDILNQGFTPQYV